MMKYKKQELIGEGSFGSVYIVRNERNETFALKTIQVDPFAVDQALLEIQMMKKFSHQSLVKIHDFSMTEENQLQIVMEYCKDGDLQKYFQVKNKKLPPQEILSIFRQMVKAFLLMSVKGVIHRDIKPENIMLAKNSIIKIADFGCARSIGEMEMSKIDNFSIDKGTFLYASPEQLKNEPYSFKCDVWAAGCIAFLLSFGNHPFVDSKPHFTLQKIKALTQNKSIQVENSCEPSIAQFIKLSLIYTDKERASWRQIWLARIFAPKITDIKQFLVYLKNLSAIASWITKEFWKVRKEFNISKNSDQIFIYFLIKFQMTNLKMALKVLKKSQQYRYLFDENSFNNYEPSEQQFNQIKKAYLEHEKYFSTIKKTMQAKESFKEIEERDYVRVSSFADLAQSVRAAYKILSDVKSKIQDKKDKIWQVMAAWVNFESRFSYEVNPNPDKVGEGGEINIADELLKYEEGIVE